MSSISVSGLIAVDVSHMRPSKSGECNLFKAQATLKNTKLIAGQIEALVPNDVNTIISLAVNFNGLN
jgi:hypothetical protein